MSKVYFTLTGTKYYFGNDGVFMTHLSAYIINNKLQTIKKDISEEE